MAFQFKTDQELFEDAEELLNRKRIIPEPNSLMEKARAELEDSRRKSALTKETCRSFADHYRKRYAEVLPKPKDIEVRGETQYDAEKKAHRRLMERWHSGYLTLETVVNNAADAAQIGEFPFTTELLSFGDQEEGEVKARYDYFEEMSRRFGDMTGVGQVGKFFEEVQKEVKIIKRRPGLGLMGIFFFIFGALVTLAGAGVVDFLPLFVENWMNRYAAVRILVSVLVGLMGWFVSALSKETKESFWLLKFWMNGLFALVVALGGTTVALSTLVAGAPIDPINFFPFGVYYLILGVLVFIQEMIENVHLMRDKPRARKHLRQLARDNAEHTHRYIRFHILWWKCIYGDRALPQGIVNAQKSFKKALKLYKQYK